MAGAPGVGNDPRPEYPRPRAADLSMEKKELVGKVPDFHPDPHVRPRAEPRLVALDGLTIELDPVLADQSPVEPTTLQHPATAALDEASLPKISDDDWAVRRPPPVPKRTLIRHAVHDAAGCARENLLVPCVLQREGRTDVGPVLRRRKSCGSSQDDERGEDP